MRDYKHVWAAPLPSMEQVANVAQKEVGAGKLAEVPFEKRVAVVR